MDEKKVTSAPEQSGDRDQALFASIQREKQRKKRRRIIVTVSIVVVLALAIFFGVRAAKKKVSEAVGSRNAPTVSEATVTTGSISTTVSGSGILTDADTQQIEIAMQRVSRIQVSLFIRLQFLSLCCRGQTVRRILARKLSKAVDYHRKV